jgi:hypothetical protein
MHPIIVYYFEELIIVSNYVEINFSIIYKNVSTQFFIIMIGRL